MDEELETTSDGECATASRPPLSFVLVEVVPVMSTEVWGKSRRGTKACTILDIMKTAATRLEDATRPFILVERTCA
jgi:hypothetical protein